ncbi:hypothetical protein Tco_0668796 [Tanacetum coccineum]
MLCGSPPMKASISWACAFHQDKVSSVKVPVANVYSALPQAHWRYEKSLINSSNYAFLFLLQEFLWVSVFLLELSEVAMAAACAFRAEEMPSLISFRMESKIWTGVSDVDLLFGGISINK